MKKGGNFEVGGPYGGVAHMWGWGLRTTAFEYQLREAAFETHMLDFDESRVIFSFVSLSSYPKGPKMSHLWAVVPPR